MTKAASQLSSPDYLRSLGYVEVDGLWIGPETYMRPFIEEVIDLAEAFHAAQQRAATEEMIRLTKAYQEFRTLVTRSAHQQCDGQYKATAVKCCTCHCGWLGHD